MEWRRLAVLAFPGLVFAIAFAGAVGTEMPGASLAAQSITLPYDPGVRGGDPGAGGPIDGLTMGQNRFFDAGQEEFAEADPVDEGLGPRFNLDSCGGCHSQPAIGGTSPEINPEIVAATDAGAQNQIPFFLRPRGPAREVRYKYKADGVTRDGGVHNLFVITGRSDAPIDCQISQEDFAAEAHRDNLIFRIPTPTFGLGLVEAIPDYVIDRDLRTNSAAKQDMGITGRLNRNGNDGTITRFGWKAQNESLLMFSGEAYNVEMGISNELFQSERDETGACHTVPVPNSVADLEAEDPVDATSAIEKFTDFMRFLAPPRPSQTLPGGETSITSGRALFRSTGCALCHTPTLRTGNSPIEALRDKPVHLFSDLALHKMGPGLADDIIQGGALPDEFRTAPLWGLGQRLFFLHDGRTSNLLVAIRAHRSAASADFRGSEANRVISLFNDLPAEQQQDILNFLRSL